MKSSLSSQKKHPTQEKVFFQQQKINLYKVRGEYLVISGVENYFFKSRILSLIKKNQPLGGTQRFALHALSLSLPLCLSLQSGHFQFTLADMLEKCFALVSLSSRGLGIFNLICSAVFPWFRFQTFFRIFYLYRVSDFQKRGFFRFLTACENFRTGFAAKEMEPNEVSGTI